VTLPLSEISARPTDLIADSFGKEFREGIRRSYQAISIEVSYELAVQCVHVAGIVSRRDLSVIGVEDFAPKGPCDASAGPWVV